MRHGFIKVATATPHVRVADCRYNGEKIIEMMKQSSRAGVRLLVTPELGVTGYTCGDLFLQKTLLDGAITTLRAITDASNELRQIVVVGVPLVYDGKLYNCAAVLYNGKVLGVVPKCNIPNHGEFYEKRYFNPAPQENSTIQLWGREVPFGSKLLFQCNLIKDFCLGVEICEDLWVPHAPSIRHASAGATVIANLSASNEYVDKSVYRRELVSSHSGRLVSGYLYADAGEGESSTDLVFSGHNLIAENGNVLAESSLFEDGIIITELDVQKLAAERLRMTTFPSGDRTEYQVIPFDMELTITSISRKISKQPFVPDSETEWASRCNAILSMQTMGLKKRLEHSNAKTLVLGVSGGLDSTLALLVAVQASDRLKRPRTDILAVTMPCFGTTKRTKNNAELLCECLGVNFRSIDITESVRLHFRDIGQNEEKQDVTYENAQARERTQVLMDLANQTEGIVVGTGDLSELALGWATYNGDQMSMYGVNSSIPKTLIRHIVRYYADTTKNRRLKTVLADILDTPVSPELLPAKEGEIVQKTEELVGPYVLHDFFLYYMVRYGFSPLKIFRLAGIAFSADYDRETILAWLKVFYRRFFSQQFKRSCMPDGPKVGSVTLSPRGDWRMPSDACVGLWLEELERF